MFVILGIGLYTIFGEESGNPKVRHGIEFNSQNICYKAEHC